MRKYITDINNRFNGLSLLTRRVIVLVSASAFAAACFAIIIKSIFL